MEARRSNGRAYSPRDAWIPAESGGQFRTHDGERYARDPQTGVIRRLSTKVKGKAARRLEKLARRAR